MRKKQTYTYDFECLDLDTYEFSMMLRAEAGIMEFVFSKASNVLKERHGIDAKNKQDVSEFDVPPIYFNYIRVRIKRELSKRFKEIEEDGIRVLDQYVKGCRFFKTNDKWHMVILIGGRYVDERQSVAGAKHERRRERKER